MNENFLDLVTEQEYFDVKTYFPNFFKKLFPIIVGWKQSKDNKNLIVYNFCAKCMFAYLGSLTSQNNSVVNTLKHFASCVKPHDNGYAGPFYKFKDGNIYDVDKSLDVYTFIKEINCSSHEFNLFLFELSQKEQLNYAVFRKLLLNFTKNILENIDSNSPDLTSLEFAELTYINSIYDELSSINMQEILENNI